MIALHAGFAETEFTPEPGPALFGQMHERIATHARDPLMACAAAFHGKGEESEAEPVVLVSVDVCVLDHAFVARAQQAFARVSGFAGERLLLHATHTHVAPVTVAALGSEPDPTFLERLHHAVVDAAAQALARLAPVSLFAGTGHMEHMGWNRRAMFADGTSRMYGHSDSPGFIGMEGPRDPTLPVLAFCDASGAVRGVVVNFSTHPNCLENECVYSADIPGAVRRVLKDLFGDIAVLYLTGAAGNTAPSLLDPHVPEQPWRGETGLRRSGLYLGGEVAKVIASVTSPTPDPVLRLTQTEVAIPLRPWPARDEPAYPEPLRTAAWPEARDYYARAEREWPQRLADASPERVRLSVLRLGDAAICTNPAELFVEYGLTIRDASPSRVTLISQLTDGYVGYVPTPLAFSRGGYETWCAPSSRLAADAGERIVAASRQLLAAAFPP
jgi:hypothetical protein